jgi:hypothetical protein
MSKGQVKSGGVDSGDCMSIEEGVLCWLLVASVVVLAYRTPP